MFRFLVSDEPGVPPKRKQVSFACDNCRKRKKRCVHHNNTPSTQRESAAPEDSAPPRSLPQPTSSSLSLHPTPPAQDQEPGVVLSPPTPVTSTLDRQPRLVNYSVSTFASPSASDLATGLGSGSTPRTIPESSVQSVTASREARFVGDMNPEGLLVEAVNSHAKRDSSQRGGVGTWVSNLGTSSTVARGSLVHYEGLESVILPYVHGVCLKCVPSDTDYAALEAIYLAKIHPLFPVFDKASLHATRRDDTLSLSPAVILVRQTISLVASTDVSSLPHLRLSSQNRENRNTIGQNNIGKSLLSQAEFAATLRPVIQAVIDSGIITDKMVLTRCLSLLSLYIQPTGLSDADISSLLGSRAIHHAQTLALQLKRKTTIDDDSLEGDDKDDDVDSERLFLCLWAMDTLNAAFYGRPCLMHERDFGRNIDQATTRQEPPFRMLLVVIRLMGKVMALYRPEASVSDDFFDLNALEGLIIGAGAARINSNLLATIETLYNAITILSSRIPPPGSGRGTVPPPPSSCRRSLAAERITFIVGTEFSLSTLASFPIVPYAVSLALSVAYRKMRYTRVPMYWTRARRAFAENCRLLREMGDVFWSARQLADLGERVLSEMEKAASSFAPADQRQARPLVSGGRQNVEGNAAVVGTAPRVLGEAEGVDVGVGRGDSTMGHADVLVLDGNLAGSDLVMGSFESLPDWDLFGHLDPGFNIDAVDAALEANLDLGLQVNWPNWGANL